MRDTIASDLAEAVVAIQGLRVDLDAIFKRAGLFDHEGKAADEVLTFVVARMLRFQCWLEDVGKETR